MEWFKKLDSLFFILGRSMLELYIIGPRLSKVFDITGGLLVLATKDRN